MLKGIELEYPPNDHTNRIIMDFYDDGTVIFHRDPEALIKSHHIIYACEMLKAHVIREALDSDEDRPLPSSTQSSE